MKYYSKGSHDILQGGSVQRLQEFRRRAAASKHNPDWRAHRYSKLNSSNGNGMGWNEDRRGKREPVYYGFDLSTAPVRTWRYADDICKRFPSGFFADFHCMGGQGIVRGVVFSLPHGRYLPGYHWTDNDEFAIYVNQSHDDEEDCAGEASGYAGIYAESLRDNDERFYAMTNAESLCESKESDLRNAWEEYRMAWYAYLQNPRFHRQAIKAQDWVREMISDLRAFRKELKSLTTAYENGR